LRAKSTVRPGILLHRTPASSRNSSCTIANRSSSVNSLALLRVDPDGDDQLVEQLPSRAITSRCPFVIGSNWPGE
jgi:hypothetical protein